MILSPGQLYRLKVRLPLSHIREIRNRHGELGQRMLLRDVATRLGGLGFSEVENVSQDPTNDKLVIASARAHMTSPRTDTILEVLEARPIAETPASTNVYKGPPLDIGLHPAESATVLYALQTETNPRHLNGLATTLEPFFPFASSLLRGRCLLFEAAREHLLTEHERDEGCQALLDYLVGPRELPNGNSNEAQTAAFLGQQVQRWGRALGMTPQATNDEVRRCATFISSHRPEADVMRFPEQIRDAGASCVEEILPGVRIVSPEILSFVLPVTGEEGIVSPTAITLVEAATKPVSAGVADAEEARRTFMILTGAAPAEPGVDPAVMLKAQAQVERAMRAIERKRWVDYYRRTIEAERAPA